MGGNALSYTTVRLTSKNYFRMADHCVEKLRALYPHGRFEAIQSYASKADFGDLDILAFDSNYDPHTAAAALGSVETVRNSSVTSLGIKVKPDLPYLDGNVFQVDLIYAPLSEFDFSSAYFRFSDLGNLLGRIAHAMGLTLGHDGLTLRMRDGTHMFANITLTHDYHQALTFLGYDPSVFANGFDTLSDIFDYVASSPFFNPDIFLLENRNNASRTRDRKRPTYTAFLAYCQQNANNLTRFPFPANKADWLPRMAQHFPLFQAQYNLELARLDQQRAVKAKFNGEWVSQLTGLQGKELGFLMKRFKESFESVEAQRDYVLCTSLADIESRVRQVQAEMYG